MRAENFDHIVNITVGYSLHSPCRSKRGAVLFNPETFELIAGGYNYQPAPFVCDGSERCKSTCGRTAIHAEQVTLLWGKEKAYRAHMIHTKTVDGILVPSHAPSCLECSKLMLASGVTGVWMFYESGWTYTPIAEFHQQSADFHSIELK